MLHVNVRRYCTRYRRVCLVRFLLYGNKYGSCRILCHVIAVARVGRCQFSLGNGYGSASRRVPLHVLAAVDTKRVCAFIVRAELDATLAAIEMHSVSAFGGMAEGVVTGSGANTFA